MRLLACVLLCVLAKVVLPFTIQRNSVNHRPYNTQPEEPRKTFNKTSLKAFVDSLPKSMVFLGTTSDGKAIFAESNLMSWQDARTYCQAANLRLLKILSQEQLQFIDKNGPNEEHWTGAREVRDLQGFMWDDLFFYEPIAFWSSYGWEGESPWNPYHACLSIRREENISSFYYRLCNQQLKVLCEAEFSNTDTQ